MDHGALAIVLHAHLPYVRHPEYDDFLEERWLFAAITECYLPLLDVLDRLHRDRIPVRLALSLSPTLLAMLADPLLGARYQRVLAAQIDLADREVERHPPGSPFRPAAEHHARAFRQARATWNAWNGNLITAFRWVIGSGMATPWTTAATHGFLPLWRDQPFTLHHQIGVGIRSFRRHIGRAPTGFWLPECGYFPGVEIPLGEQGIRAIVLETHGLLNAKPVPPDVPYRPVRCPNHVAAFARDPHCARAVWSRHEGYPGDPGYREYHRDIGFERDLAELGEVPVDGHLRTETGIKLHAVSGGEDKQPYQPDLARQRAIDHARHFVEQRRIQSVELTRSMGRPPVLVAPYDAELFGHWWYEGPIFLENVFRCLAEDPRVLRPAAPEDLLDASDLPVVQPAASTWGEHGYHAVWVHEENEWTLPHLHQLARQVEAATRSAETSAHPLLLRAARQALRELLLAQASDWPFIMKNQTATGYADQRVRDHLARGSHLCQAILANTVDPAILEDIEALDPIFPDPDLAGATA